MDISHITQKQTAPRLGGDTKSSASSAQVKTSVSQSISSLAQRLALASRSIDREGVSQLEGEALKQRLASGAYSSTSPSDRADSPLSGLAKQQLETVIFDPSGTFSADEKGDALLAWKSLDGEQTRQLLKDGLTAYQVSGSTDAWSSQIQSHFQSLSNMGKALVPEQYVEELDSQFHALLNTSEAASKNDYYDVMVSDLFDGLERGPRNKATGMSKENLLRPDFDFLTREDRQLLTEMYQYADKEGIDYKHIRTLASDLGLYRRHNDGRLLSSFNEAGVYDMEGHRRTVRFTDEDQLVVDRIQNSNTLNSAALDRGFLDFMLEPGLGAMSHRVKYPFLEHMVNVFASDNPLEMPSEGRFATHTPFASQEERMIMETSEEVLYQPVEPDFAYKDGVWSVTEKGRQKGLTFDGEGSSPIMPEMSQIPKELHTLLVMLGEETPETPAIWGQWYAAQ